MKYGIWVFSLVVCLFSAVNLGAQETIVPAGTLLNCTLDEPNLSSQSAAINDPVMCRVGQLGQFGRTVFPRGAYLSGRVADYRDPGRFVGKGWMRLEFDRIVLPNAVIPVSGKMIAVSSFPVDKEGRLLGRGHPKRDAILWTIPLFWPTKLITLPARGPRPALRGETRLTVRLMDDLSVPVTSSANPASGWRRFERPRSLPAPTRSPLSSAPRNGPQIRYAGISIPALEQVPGSIYDQGADRRSLAPVPVGSKPSQEPHLTALVLRDQTVVVVSDYWLKEGALFYETFPSGTKSFTGIDQVDWVRTILVNAERGVKVVARRAP